MFTPHSYMGCEHSSVKTSLTRGPARGYKMFTHGENAMSKMTINEETVMQLSDAFIGECLTGSGHLLNYYGAALMAALTLSGIILAVATPTPEAIPENKTVLLDMFRQTLERMEVIGTKDLDDIREQFVSMITPTIHDDPATDSVN